LASKANDLPDHQLCHASRICERGVKNGYSVSGGEIEVDLVGTDAKASNNNQVLCFPEYFRRQLRLRSDTQDVNISGQVTISIQDKTLEV
jgi:hypothetical protein